MFQSIARGQARMFLVLYTYVQSTPFMYSFTKQGSKLPGNGL